MTYTILPDQSLFDIAIAVYGDVSGFAWLLADNPGLGLTDRLRAGDTLTIRDATVNPRVRDYVNDFGPQQTSFPEDRPVGVGYWRLDEHVIS